MNVPTLSGWQAGRLPHKTTRNDLPIVVRASRLPITRAPGSLVGQASRLPITRVSGRFVVRASRPHNS